MFWVTVPLINQVFKKCGFIMCAVQQCITQNQF